MGDGRSLDLARAKAAVFALLATLMIAAVASSAHALDPVRSIGQYRHVVWRAEDGAPSANDIAQTPDGYLWFSSAAGLYRFDGVTFDKVPVGGRKLGIGPGVLNLLVDRGGGLILGFGPGGVGRLKDGKFTPFGHEKITGSVMALAEDHEGGIWSAMTGKVGLARYKNGRWDLVDESWNAPEGLVFSLAVDHRGDLWAAGDQMLYRLRAGSRRFEKIPIAVGAGPGMIADSSGGLVISDSLGVRRLDLSTLAVAPSSSRQVGQKTRMNRLQFDRDGNLWGATVGSGLFRIRANLSGGRERLADSKPVETMDVDNGLTANVVWRVFEDREGSLWVATSAGIDQFTPAAIAVQQDVQSYPSWDFGLYRLKDGTVIVSDDRRLYRAPPGQALRPWLEDLDFICDGPNGVQWAGKASKLFRLQNGRRTPVPLPPWMTIFSYCKSDAAGRLWMAMIYNGVAMFDGRSWRRFDEPDGKWVTVLGHAPDGAVTLAGGRRAFRAEPGGLRPLMSAPSSVGSLSAIGTDGSDVLAGARFGVLRIKGRGDGSGRTQTLDVESYAWADHVVGVAAGQGQRTWLLSRTGLISAPTAQLAHAFDVKGAPFDVRIFDSQDGLVGEAASKGADKLIAGPDGRIWLATDGRVAMIDPSHIPHNDAPPPVVIKSLVVDGKRIAPSANLLLPKGAKSLQID